MSFSSEQAQIVLNRPDGTPTNPPVRVGAFLASLIMNSPASSVAEGVDMYSVAQFLAQNRTDADQPLTAAEITGVYAALDAACQRGDLTVAEVGQIVAAIGPRPTA